MTIVPGAESESSTDIVARSRSVPIHVVASGREAPLSTAAGVRLRHPVTAGTLADTETSRTRRQLQDRGAHERVVEHDVRVLKPAHGSNRQQLGIPWTGADERHASTTVQRPHAARTCDSAGFGYDTDSVNPVSRTPATMLPRVTGI